MRFSTAVYAAIALATSVSSSPIVKKVDVNGKQCFVFLLLRITFSLLPLADGDVLNYALTLEHLEAAFYSGALGQFSAEDFASAGYPDWVRNRIAQISAHETSHVEFLSTALNAAGITPTDACTYELYVPLL